MITREKAREITEAVIKAEEEKMTEAVRHFVSTEATKKITEVAERGRFDTMLIIPSKLDVKQTVSLIEEAGFTVKGPYGYNEYNISW